MRKSKSKKKDWMGILIFLIFIIGLSIMLYPIVSDYWNSRVQSKAVAAYDTKVQNMTDNNKEEMYQQAVEYNEKLKKMDDPFLDYKFIDNYNDVLNVSGTGIMGYIEISRIDVELPIYHGTSKGVLQVACGHLEGTCLPTGGIGTHTVLSAHRGLPSAKLFTDLDKIEVGDTFSVTVLDKKMNYVVDQIKVVEPQETEDLKIDPDKEYVTLMTCTPYGINSHRLLVRGVRDTQKPPEQFVAADAHQVNTTIVAIVLAIIMLVIVMIVYIIIQYRTKHKKVNQEVKDEKEDN